MYALLHVSGYIWTIGSICGICCEVPLRGGNEHCRISLRAVCPEGGSQVIAGLNLHQVFKSGKIKCTLFLTFPASTLPDFLRREVFICFESHSASHLVPRSIAFKLRCYSSDSCRNKCVSDELSRPTRTTWSACYLAFSLSPSAAFTSAFSTCSAFYVSHFILRCKTAGFDIRKSKSGHK